MSRLIAIAVVGGLVLGGCGFTLQGAYTLPPEMSTTYISASDRYSELYRGLVQGLRNAGVNVVDSPVEGTATLTILAQDTGQRVLSVSARNVPTEYEVFYSVEYALAHDERSLLAPRQLTLTRDYTYNENLVLGKAAEEQQLRDAIVDDLVRIIIKQLDSI